MATKKIRLMDEEPVAETPTTESSTDAASLTPDQAEKLMKYAEAIDWKLWEILKLLKAQVKD